MPLVQKTLTLAAGATSDNILANTNYEFVDGNVRLRVASAVDSWYKCNRRHFFECFGK
jgi:hypothetical protein